MRRTAAAIIISTLLAPLAAARAADAPLAPVFNIMGPSTCAGWPRAGRLESAAKAVPLNWVLGFASGEAEQSDMRLLALLEPEKVDAWVGTYCQAHPTDSLPAAGRAMVAEWKAALPPLAPPPPPEPPMFVPPLATPAKPAPTKPAVRRSAPRRSAAKK